MHANFLKFVFLAIWLTGAGVFADHSNSNEGLVVREEAAYAEIAARATITPAPTTLKTSVVAVKTSSTSSAVAEDAVAKPKSVKSKTKTSKKGKKKGKKLSPGVLAAIVIVIVIILLIVLLVILWKARQAKKNKAAAAGSAYVPPTQ